MTHIFTKDTLIKDGYSKTSYRGLATGNKTNSSGFIYTGGQLRNRLRLVKGGFGYAKDPVFLLSLALYIINRLLIKPHWPRHWMLGPFVHDHLNDSLLVPVALPLFLAVYRGLNLRDHDHPPTLRETMGHALLWSIYFEVFAPRFLHHGTADFGDAVSYVVGGLVAWALWNYPFRLLDRLSPKPGSY